MDTYENNELTPQPEPEQEAHPQPVSSEERISQAVPEAISQVQSNAEPVSTPAETPAEEAPPILNHATNYHSTQHEYESNTCQAQYTEAEPVSKHKKNHKRKKVWKAVLAAVLVVALVAAGCGITAAAVNNHWNIRAQKMTEQLQQMENTIADLKEFVNDNSFTGKGNSVSGSPNATPDGSLTPGQVYAKSQKSVVAISSKIVDNSFGQPTIRTSTGSGFIISEDGYIVTNYHVVEGSSGVLVTTHDKKEYEASIVGYDENHDMAVLKVDAADLLAVTLGSSDALIVGDQVVAIGNPLGKLTNSLTVGYISAKDRSVSTDGTSINMLQTDAAINSGNSGGPLFNMKGEVIGITSAKYSGTTSSGAVIEGIGFAIPMDDVIKKINNLMTQGFITSAYLGVYVRDMDPSLSAYGIPIGLYVDEVIEGFCAKKAGVQAQDIILALGEYSINNLNALTRALDKFQPGDTTTITVWRAGIQLELTITLDEKPQT